MNINKKLIKGTAITAATVTVIAATGFHMVNAADINKIGVNTDGIVRVADNETTTKLNASDIANNAFKDETVYVMADAAGNTQKVIVSDWLKNVNASAGLGDFSTLANVMNVKGNESFENGDNNQLTWNAQGKDIYYQGTSDAQLPVSVKVTYKLDGQEIAPADLVGKSGKLTVRYDYTNLLKESADINGTQEDIYTPLLMITGTVLPTEHYTNVEVTNGKIISDGNNQMVVGIGLPGLKDSLKVEEDKVKIPDYFEYTADVTDYEAGVSASVGLTDVLSDLDINGEDMDLDDIQKKVDDLVDGVDKLADGSSDLYDGAGKLKDGTSELQDGTSDLKDGTGKLQDGTGKLADGSNKLYDGLSQLLSKTGDFKTAANTLSSSLTTLKGALGKLETGAKSLDEGAGKLVDGASSLKTGLGSAKDGMDKIVSNYSAVEGGVAQLKSGVKSAADGMTSLSTNLAAVNGTYDKLSETVANDEAIIAALKQVNAAYKDETIAAVITKLEANTAGQKQIAAGLTDAGKKLVAGAKSLGEGAGKLDAGIDSLSAGVKALSDGSKTVQGGLGQLYTGSDNLLTGAKQLSAGTASLVSNTKELAGAGNKLADGGNSLVTATTQLGTAVGQLHDGSKTLNDGIATLDKNVVKLNDGAVKLNDGAVKLNDGAVKLTDGAGELKDGIQTLKTDGIDKITDLVNGDLKNVVERFKAVVDQSKSYKNYSGIGDAMDGSVKFVIKYEDGSQNK